MISMITSVIDMYQHNSKTHPRMIIQIPDLSYGEKNTDGTTCTQIQYYNGKCTVCGWEGQCTKTKDGDLVCSFSCYNRYVRGARNIHREQKWLGMIKRSDIEKIIRCRASPPMYSRRCNPQDNTHLFCHP